MSICEHCQYFQVELSEGPLPGDRLVGHCRRFPPTAGRQTPAKHGATKDDVSHFPVVRGKDWCGEFQEATSPYRRMSALADMKEPPSDRRLVVSMREAAAMLDVSIRHLYRMSAVGEIPRTRIGGRVCIRIETLNAWLKSHEE